MIDASPGVDAGDAASTQEGVARHTEDPLGRSELGFRLGQRLDLAADFGVEVPPTGTIRNKVKRLAVWCGQEQRFPVDRISERTILARRVSEI